MKQEMGDKSWQVFFDLEAPYNTKLKYYQVEQDPFFQLVGRPTKRNFLEVLVSSRQLPQQQGHWPVVLDLLKCLDYWANKRNEMIHQNQGMSLERMENLFKRENPDACPPQEICLVMADICNSELGIIPKQYRQRFVGNQADYYLYTSIRKWAISELLK
ncbi:MAG: hypothetical protein F6K58_08640 [Symploca sp. SIO2E9]|nr:hypothetical protein [Symploca sp. SIO2E9]